MGFLSWILILLLVAPALVRAGAPIEIYADGKRFTSLAEYKVYSLTSRNKVDEQAEDQELPVNPDSAQQQHIEETAKFLGVKIDPNKIKTIDVKPVLSRKTQQKLRFVSAEDGVNKGVADFRQDWANPKPRQFVSSENLEGKIREVVGVNHDPLLLISNDNKMRIMVLKPEQKQVASP